MANKKSETTTKFKVDITELVSGLQKAKRQIALANAEFRAATSGMDNWAKSADGITAKLTQLDRTLSGQKTILANLERQYELTVGEMGEGSKQAETLRIRIENQKASIAKTEKQINQYTDALTDIKEESDRSATAMNKLSEKISDQEKELEDLKRTYANAVLEYGKNSKEAKDLAKQIDSLSTELVDNKREMDKAEKSADSFDNTLDDLSDSADDSSDSFTVMKGALANLVADGIKKAASELRDFAKSSVTTGSDFEASMSEVAAISGATGENLELLRNTAKEYGATTVFSATESAQALKYMSLAGWDAKTSTEGLGGVLALASAAGMDLAKASDMVTDYLSAFGMTADKSTYFADMLAYAQSNANTSAEQLGEAYKNCAANLHASGQSVETVTSLLSMMANQGLKSAEAGTSVTAMMRDLTSKMKDGQVMIGDTAVTIMDANGNYRDMIDVLSDVEAATSGMGDAERATALSTTFTSDSLKGLNLLLNAGSGAARDFRDRLEDANGTAQKTGDTMNDNLTGDVKAAQSAFEDLQIAAYEELQPSLRKIVQYATQTIIPMVKDKVIPAIKDEIIPAVKEFIGWITDNKDAVIAGIAGIGAAFVAWNVATMIHRVVRSINAFKKANEGATIAQWAFNTAMKMNVIGIVISLIVGLVTAFVVLWNKSEAFRNFWINLWAKIKNTVSAAVQAISQFFRNLWTGVQKIWSSATGWFSTNVIDPIVGFFQNLWTTVSGFFVSLWSDIRATWTAVSTWFHDSVIQPVVGFFSQLWADIVAIFSPAVQWFGELFSSIWATLSSTVEVITGLLQGCWEIICRVFEVAGEWFDTNVIQPVAQFFSDLWEQISEQAKQAWDFIVEIFTQAAAWFNDAVIQPIVQFFVQLWAQITNGAQAAWSGVKNVYSAVASWFNSTVVQPAAGFFRDMWAKLTSGAAQAWSGIKDVFSSVASFFGQVFGDAWQKVKDIFSTGGKIFDGIKDGIVSAFKDIVNAIIRGINRTISVPFNAINGVLDKIRGVNILGISPFQDLGSISVPVIPELYRGGVLRKGQVGFLEGNGDEAVVPLEKNTGWLDEVAKRIVDRSGGAGNQPQTVNNNYNYEYNQTNNSPKALSRLEIYRQTKNQFAYAVGGNT